MITLASALGQMARPFASVVAHWRNVPTWRRRIVRAAYPDLARALDRLDKSVNDTLGPL